MSCAIKAAARQRHQLELHTNSRLQPAKNSERSADVHAQGVTDPSLTWPWY